MLLRVLGIVAASEGGFLSLRYGRLKRLAHFLGHDSSEPLGFRFENLRSFRKFLRPLAVGCVALFAKRLHCQIELLTDL